MRARAFLSLCVAWISVSCGHASAPKTPKARLVVGRPNVTLRLWIDADPRIDRAVTFKACNAWNIENVHCVEATSADASDVRVSVKDMDCLQRNDAGALTGSVTLGEAWRDGRIWMMAGCLDKAGAVFEPHQFAAVFAHEIGHELDIWDHIPEVCGKDALLHPSGRKICGRALMNPYYHREINYVTVLDDLAFDLRKRDESVPDSMEERGAPDCVYSAPAK